MRRTFGAAAIAAVAAVAAGRHRHAARVVARQPALAPELDGTKVVVSVPWGSVSYRHRAARDADAPSVVLVHGWGRTADTAWWRLLPLLEGEVVAVDLPGHGLSELHGTFSFDRAAEAVLTAVEHARLERPVLVGHSMGGPAALEAASTRPDAFAHLVAVATSAFWVRPRTRIMMSAAPFVLGDRSPLVVGTLHRSYRADPDNAPFVAWSHAVRPRRRILVESAWALRCFDARSREFTLPPTTWVVTARDAVVAPRFQRASAEVFGAAVIEIDADHSAPLSAPALVAGAIEAALVGGRIP